MINLSLCLTISVRTELNNIEYKMHFKVIRKTNDSVADPRGDSGVNNPGLSS